MQRSILVLTVISCIALLASANVFQERVRIAGEHRSHTIAKHGWSRVQRAVPSHPLSLLFALKQQNIDQLQTKLHDFSNPKSPNHGLRMSREQIRDLIAPSSVTVNAVKGWIQQTSPQAQIELNAGGDFLHVSLPAEHAEALFGVEFHVYRHADTGREIVRAASDTATMPAAIKPLVDVVGGLHSFPKHKPRFNKNAKISGSHHSAVRTMAVGDTNYTDTFITSAVGADNAVGLLIVPICSNGMATLTTNASALCADHPPMIQSFNVRAIMTLTGQTVVGSVALSDLVVCKIVNDGSTAFPQTQCQLALKTIGGMTIENYKPYRFGVQALFAGGMRSPILMNANTQYPTIWAWPNALYQRYYVYPNQATGDVRSSQAVIEFSNEFYSPSDLKYFLTTVGVDASQADQVRVVGINNGTMPGGEGNLDIQYMLALSPFARTTYWSVNPNGDGWIMEYQAEVSNTADTELPLVHSISWGSTEADQDNDYLARATVEFMKMGARGVTVLVSSGDDGVSEDDPNCNYTPDFPTGNPYVTSVGATSFSSYTSAACSGLKTPDSGVDVSCSVTGEIACSTLTGSLISTGGGFSNFHPMPSYQSKAVAEYLTFQNILPPASTFNRSNRGYPDLAAMGRNVPIVINGGTYRADGTSCSAPIMGAIVALINDFYLQYYNRSLGWANPFWYDMAENRPSAFQDVIIGNNRCRSKRSLVPGGDVFCCPTGFNASAGWDPLTGLGSPNVIEVQQYLLKIATDNQISSLQSQVLSLNNQLSAVNSQLSSQITNLASQVNSVSAQTNNLSSQISSVSSQTNSLATQVTALSSGYVSNDTFETDRKKLATGVIVVAVVCGFTVFGLLALLWRRKSEPKPVSTTGPLNERLLDVEA